MAVVAGVVFKNDCTADSRVPTVDSEPEWWLRASSARSLIATFARSAQTSDPRDTRVPCAAIIRREKRQRVSVSRRVAEFVLVM